MPVSYTHLAQQREGVAELCAKPDPAKRFHNRAPGQRSGRQVAGTPGRRGAPGGVIPVSYTHLDVYKRQPK